MMDLCLVLESASVLQTVQVWLTAPQPAESSIIGSWRPYVESASDFATSVCSLPKAVNAVCEDT